VVERANTSLIGQIAGLRTQLDEAERAVQSFRSQHSLVSTGEGGLIISQQLRDLYGQISQAEAELARQQARRDQLARYQSRDPLSDTLPEALTSSVVTSLRGQYAQSAREAASLAQTLAPQHPRLIEIRAELAETRRLLSGELARLRSTVQESYRQTEANLANLRKRATELTKSQEVSGAAQIKLRQLESEAEAVRTVYSASLQRAKELEQQKRIETNNSRMLSEAVAPAQPTKPPAPLVLAAALLFGACAGLGLAYLLEWLPSSRIIPERLKPLAPLTPEAAGLAIGVGTVVSLPAAAARREDALIPVTRLLQRTLGPHLPASVMIAGSVDDATQAALAEHLANSLAAHGESVLLCQDGSGRDMNIRRIEPAASATARPGRRRNFIIMRQTSSSDGKGRRATGRDRPRLLPHGRDPAQPGRPGGGDRSGRRAYRRARRSRGGGNRGAWPGGALAAPSGAGRRVTRQATMAGGLDPTRPMPVLPLVLLIGALTFNMALCFINTNVMGINDTMVMGCEVVLVATALYLGLGRNAAPYLLLAVFISYAAMLMAMRPLLDPKAGARLSDSGRLLSARQELQRPARSRSRCLDQRDHRRRLRPVRVPRPSTSTSPISTSSNTMSRAARWRRATSAARPAHSSPVACVRIHAPCCPSSVHTAPPRFSSSRSRPAISARSSISGR
jgi:hypothetical protein